MYPTMVTDSERFFFVALPKNARRSPGRFFRVIAGVVILVASGYQFPCPSQ
jgi:hypothetical protein